MIIKAVDLGLMADHLPAHEGTIAKLNHFLTLTNNPTISKIIFLQIEMMLNHVRTMLQLMEPNQQNAPNLPPLNGSTNLMKNNQQNISYTPDDRHITLEARFTAISMASENFVSAMAMKTPSVKKTHIEMALQNSTIAETYDQVIYSQGWVQPPNASAQEQLSTIQQFQHLVHQNQMSRQIIQHQPPQMNPLNYIQRQ